MYEQEADACNQGRGRRHRSQERAGSTFFHRISRSDMPNKEITSFYSQQMTRSLRCRRYAEKSRRRIDLGRYRPPEKQHGISEFTFLSLAYITICSMKS